MVTLCFLILFTSLKSLDSEQKEAASIDGANPLQMFFYIVVPHLQRAIGVVVMIETIFLLSIFAEIYTTTSGGPGHASENLAFLVYSLGIQGFNVGTGSAGGILAVILRTSSPTSWSRCLLKTSKAAHEKVRQSDFRHCRVGDRNHHFLSDFLDDDHGFQNRTRRLFARPDLHADP